MPAAAIQAAVPARPAPATASSAAAVTKPTRPIACPASVLAARSKDASDLDNHVPVNSVASAVGEPVITVDSVPPAVYPGPRPERIYCADNAVKSARSQGNGSHGGGGVGSGRGAAAARPGTGAGFATRAAGRRGGADRNARERLARRARAAG